MFPDSSGSVMVFSTTHGIVSARAEREYSWNGISVHIKHFERSQRKMRRCLWVPTPSWETDTASISPMDEGVHRAWLINKFNETIGLLRRRFLARTEPFAAEGLELVGILSFVAFTETPEPGEYWGQAAVIGYSPHYAEEFNRFIDGVCGLIGKIIRPKLALNGPAVDEIINSNGTWLPSEREPLPEKTTRHGATAKRAEGSSTASWRLDAQAKRLLHSQLAFLLALVAAIIIGLKSCGVI